MCDNSRLISLFLLIEIHNIQSKFIKPLSKSNATLYNLKKSKSFLLLEIL